MWCDVRTMKALISALSSHGRLVGKGTASEAPPDRYSSFVCVWSENRSITSKTEKRTDHQQIHTKPINYMIGYEVNNFVERYFLNKYNRVNIVVHVCIDRKICRC